MTPPTTPSTEPSTGQVTADLAAAHATIERLTLTHTKAHATASDEVWDHDPRCGACDRPWPCDTTEALTAAATILAAATAR